MAVELIKSLAHGLGLNLITMLHKPIIKLQVS